MRTANRLTSNKVKNAKPGQEGRTVLLCDGGGLWLQVGLGKDKQVTKSWIFRYAAAGTKVSKTGREYRRERQMGLGPLHTVGLAEAREMAPPGAFASSAGQGPIDERDAARGAAAAAQGKRVTFDQATEASLQKFEDAGKTALIGGSGEAPCANSSRPC